MNKYEMSRKSPSTTIMTIEAIIVSAPYGDQKLRNLIMWVFLPVRMRHVNIIRNFTVKPTELLSSAAVNCHRNCF